MSRLSYTVKWLLSNAPSKPLWLCKLDWKLYCFRGWWLYSHALRFGKYHILCDRLGRFCVYTSEPLKNPYWSGPWSKQTLVFNFFHCYAKSTWFR